MCVCVYTFIGGSIRSLVFWKMLYAERNWQNLRPERYTHTHTHTDTHTHGLSHTHTHLFSHTHLHTCTYMHIHTYPHVLSHAHTYTCFHTHTHMCFHTLMHTYMCFHTHVLSHTHTHTYCAYIAVCSATQSCPTLMTEGLNPARLLCPWDFSGKRAGMGHWLLL